jgi:hypothetical protein
VSGPPIGELIFKATFLAMWSGAAEIDIDTLLKALAAQDAPDDDVFSLLAPVAGSGSYAYYMNSDWKQLSSSAAKALAPFMDAEMIDWEALRRALLAAKQSAF